MSGISSPPPLMADTAPLAPGSATVGTSLAAARQDHVHPSAPVTVPVASNANPLVDGAAASGTSPDFSRSDHVHPLPPTPSPSTATPIIAGVGASGSSVAYARGDHVHPAQAVPAVPNASNTTPVASGAAAPGVSTDYSRADHVHPAASIAAFAFGAPNSRTLASGTAYQATDSTKAAVVAVNLTSTASLTLSGGTTNSADIVIGPTSAVAAGAGSAVGKYSNSNTGGLTIGLNLNTVSASGYAFALPAGWWFAVRVTSGAVAIVNAFDQAAG